MPVNSKKKGMMDEALGVMSASLAILEKVPQMEDNNFKLSVDVNPISFILKALYQLVGYDNVLKGITSKIVVYGLDAIELAVKTYVLTQLKYIFDCTINPFITYDLLRDGVVFDLKTVDLINMLYYSPLDKSVGNKKNNGKWYYFGCDGFDYPDQLEQAEDFNALLWYMKNRTIGQRSVWYGHKEQKNSRQYKSLYQKQSKKDGIITLEYSGRPGGLKDAEGNGMNIQTPFNNCIHVFLGNTKPVESGNANAVNNEILEIKEQQSKFIDVRRNAENIKSKLEKQLGELKSLNLTKEEYKIQKEKIKNYIKYMETVIKSIDKNKPLSSSLNKLKNQDIVKENKESGVYTIYVSLTGDTLVMSKYVYENVNGDLVSQKKVLYDNIITQSIHDIYRPVEYNYYYHKTLLQFNIDYIFSLKLFDGVVLGARLLDALSGCLTVGVDLSFQERMVQNEVRRIIRDMIQDDEVVINDCFFTFDNETYNELMQRSEYQRLGLYVSPSGMIGGTMDPDSIMQSLNDLSPDATPEQLQTAIENSIFTLCKEAVPEYNDGGDPEFDVNFRSNLVDNLLETLAYVIILTVLSPKLYLLIAINLKIMGRESNFDMLSFMDNFRQLISGIVKTIRDELIRILKEWLMEIIGNLAKEVGAKIAVEQIMYYQQLLRKCVECFRLHGSGLVGWNQADVDYADIYETENNEPINAEC